MGGNHQELFGHVSTVLNGTGSAAGNTRGSTRLWFNALQILLARSCLMFANSCTGSRRPFSFNAEKGIGKGPHTASEGCPGSSHPQGAQIHD